jgi:hypothetical protein
MTNSAQFDNLQNIGSNKGYVGDYAHAAALYLRSGYRLAPKTKFLYHVNIGINPTALKSLGAAGNFLQNNRKELNLLVSTVELPRFTVDTDTKNQYNRKKIIQRRTRYDPIRMTFHDDRQGNTTLFWEAYFRYYNQDPNYTSRFAFPPNNMYSGGLRRYGLDRTNRLNTPFLQYITVSQLYSIQGSHEFTGFTLINPMITNWEHDEMDQSNGNTFARNTLSIEYESVSYDREQSGEDNPPGFRDPAYYDTGKSKLSTNIPGTQGRFTTGNLWADLTNGNRDLGTLLNAFRFINQDLPTNNTGFNIPSGQTNILASVIGGASSFAFPRSSNYNELTQTLQKVSDFSNVLSALTNSEVRDEARRNPAFAAELGQSAINLLPPSSFTASLQPVVTSIGLLGSVNERNAAYNNLSSNQRQSCVNTAVANVSTLRARF